MNSSNSSQTTSKPRVLIIPAAGAGVRFRELGKNYPKCILPVRGVPIIVTAIRELADSSGVFSKVVVAASNSTHAQEITDALAPFKLQTEIEVVDVHVPHWLKPSPAVSLNQTVLGQLARNGGQDFDVTVFLSDMLPKNKRVIASVIDMPSDSWGVVKKNPDDFRRWCMVQPLESGAIVFHDKPVNAPATNLAAVGVYRYSSAVTLVEMFDNYSREFGDQTEMQFSDVVSSYQRVRPISLTLFDQDDFQDFGTLEEYLANKGLSNCRSFNKVLDNVRQGTVTKSSTLVDKIKDEAVWLMNAPRPLQKYLPRVEAADLMRGSITMEKIRSSNLRDVALYLDRSYDTWVEVFKKVSEYLSATPTLRDQLGRTLCNNADFWGKMWAKTEERLEAIKCIEDKSFARQWLYNDFAKTTANFTRREDEDPVAYMHGDLHFANMFYCFHYKDLKVIDPRGEVRGSQYYDIAKLCHSVFGRYDYIDAELYGIFNGVPRYYDKGHENIERAFIDVIFDEFSHETKVDLIRLTASLFLSMIPLHADKPEHCQLFYDEFIRLAALALSMEQTGKNPLDIGV